MVSALAIKLMFLEDICIYFVFYVNLLKPAATNPLHAGYIQLFLPSIKVNSEAKWEVNVIVNLRYFGHAKKLQYQV